MGALFKKYSGVSRVTEHETEKGVRFDFISLPAVSNTDAKAPNVTIPVGVHPWDVKVIILLFLQTGPGVEGCYLFRRFFYKTQR